MKTLKLTVMLMTIVFTSTACDAKIKNAKTETHKVYGNCDMCKKTIESAIKQNKDAKGFWNKDTKMLALTYDSTKTNADEVLKRIANVGYDNEKYLSSNEAYQKLHECCQYTRKAINTTKVVANSTTAKTEEMPKDMKMDEPIKTTTSATETTTALKNATNDFTSLLTQYYALKNALIADNANMASKSASALFVEIDAIKMESMSTDEHTVWMKYFDKLKTDATQISETKNLEKQRIAFSSLSNNLWSTVKGLKIKDNGAIYIDYCPMYNNNKGAIWLSKESTIKNPYYGKQMLTCGSIKETIK